MTAMSQESFPRKVYDENGRYTIAKTGAYEVTSPSLERLAAITYMRRDLDSAHEMVVACCNDEVKSHTGPVEQSLWIGAIVMYGKVFKRSGARRGFNATEFIRQKLMREALDRHDYLIALRDQMIAHDDGIGESKELSIYLAEQAPTYALAIGVSVGNRRVVSLGTDIAREVEPHFGYVAKIFSEIEALTRDELLRGFLVTRFAEVTLLGPSMEKPLQVDMSSVRGRRVP